MCKIQEKFFKNDKFSLYGCLANAFREVVNKNLLDFLKIAFTEEKDFLESAKKKVYYDHDKKYFKLHDYPHLFVIEDLIKVLGGEKREYP